MSLTYRNLDERTRTLMLAEIDHDIASKSLYISENLTSEGRVEYPDLLKTAAKQGSDATLAGELSSRLNSHEKPRRLKSGEFSKAPVMRSNAHEMLAEGEFNRFYIRAVCARAVEDNITGVVVYRAKSVEIARSESEKKIGQVVDPSSVLNDLRQRPGVDTALGLPPGPNSGLSVALR